MSRLPELDADRMTPEQTAVYEAIRSGPRGQVRGPFLALLHAPDLAAAVQSLGARLRFNGKIPAAEREVAILTVAAFWNCEYEWAIHCVDAEKAGVRPAAIAAIRQGGTELLAPGERTIHDFTLALLREGRVGQALYESALERWTPAGLVEINVLVGYYTLLALLLNANEIEAPASPGSRSTET